MSPSFEIVLKNEKVNLYHQFSWFILIISLLFYIYTTFAGSSFHYSNIVVLGALALLFFLKYYFRHTKWAFSLLPFFIILSLAWIKEENYWMAVAVLFFEILYMLSTRKLLLKASAENIVYPSFPIRNIAWAEVSNCLVKDGILTINLKNDRFFQQAIDETKTSVNEQEFNDFCKQQLNKQ
jgi:hypothetical protein